MKGFSPHSDPRRHLKIHSTIDGKFAIYSLDLLFCSIDFHMKMFANLSKGVKTSLMRFNEIRMDTFEREIINISFQASMDNYETSKHALPELSSEWIRINLKTPCCLSRVSMFSQPKN